MTKDSKRVKVGKVEFLVNYTREDSDPKTGINGYIEVENVFWIYAESPVEGTLTKDVLLLLYEFAPDIISKIEEQIEMSTNLSSNEILKRERERQPKQNAVYFKEEGGQGTQQKAQSLDTEKTKNEDPNK